MYDEKLPVAHCEQRLLKFFFFGQQVARNFKGYPIHSQICNEHMAKIWPRKVLCGWTSELIELLTDLYEGYPCLYNTKKLKISMIGTRKEKLWRTYSSQT